MSINSTNDDEFMCSNTSAALAVQYVNRPTGEMLSTLLLVMMGMTGVVSYGLYIARMNHFPVNNRPRWYPFVHMAGFVMIAIVGSGREVYGRDKLPCLIYLLSHLTWIPLFLFSQFAVTIQVYNRLRFHSELIALKSFVPELDLDKPMRVQINLERRAVRRLKFRASSSFGLILLGMLVAVIVSLLAAYSSRWNEWTSGCVGCELVGTDRNAFVGLGGALIVVVAWVVYKSRKLNVFDSTRVMRESVSSAVIFGVVSVIYLPLSTLDVGDLYKTYTFPFFQVYNFAAIAVVIINFLQPALRSLRSKEDYAEFFTLADMLRGGEGEALFEKHLIREFSVENYRFWKDVTKWKRSFNEPGVDNQSANGAVQRNARWIFDTYLSTTAIMTVTLSDKTLKQLKNTFESDDEVVVDGDVFDEAVQQIYKIMEFDSFTRFLASPRHKEFLQRFRGTFPKSEKSMVPSLRAGKSVKLPSLGSSHISRQESLSSLEEP